LKQRRKPVRRSSVSTAAAGAVAGDGQRQLRTEHVEQLSDAGQRRDWQGLDGVQQLLAQQLSASRPSQSNTAATGHGRCRVAGPAGGRRTL